MRSAAPDPAEGKATSETRVPTLPKTSAFLKPFESLRIRDYRIFWISMSATFSAMQMQMMARSWFMYDLTGSAIMLGSSAAASGIPMLSLSLFGGTLADRMDKRSLLLAGQMAAAVAAVIIGTIIYLNAIAWWHLIMASVFQGIVMAILMPARQAILPEMVGREHLLNAISLNAAEMNATRIIAPAIAGFLVAALGVDKVYFVMAGLYIISFLLMLRLPKYRSIHRSQRKPFIKDMGEAFSYLKRHWIIINLLIIAFITVIFGMPIQMLLPIFTEDILNVGPQGLGWLLSLGGLGALVGSIITAALGNYKGKGKLLLVLTGIFGVSIIAFTLSRRFWLSLALMIPLGLGQSGRMTVNNTLIQVNVDDYIRGRIMSMYMMTMGLQAVGVMPISVAATVIGAPLALGIAGSVVVGYTFFATIFQSTLRKLQ